MRFTTRTITLYCEDQYKRLEKIDVEAKVAGESGLAYHRGIFGRGTEKKDAGKWIVTHLATGRQVGYAIEGEEADIKRLMKILVHLPVDWNSSQPAVTKEMLYQAYEEFHHPIVQGSFW